MLGYRTCESLDHVVCFPSLQAFIDKAAKEREAGEARYKTKLEQEGLQGSNVNTFEYRGVAASAAGSCMVLGTHKASGKKYTMRFESKSFLCSDAAPRRRARDDAGTALIAEEAMLQRMVTAGPIAGGERQRHHPYPLRPAHASAPVHGTF